tara:strand:- start:27 stop:449 length:423 start_codon:yes stop_codon:yes gene_type:complete
MDFFISKRILDSNKNYSILIALLTILFSFISWINQFGSISILWIWSGFTIIFVSLMIFVGRRSLYLYLKIPSSLSRFYKIFIAFILLTYFLLSINGLVIFIDTLPFKDRSYAFVPFISFVFLISGVVLGLNQFNYNNRID